MTWGETKRLLEVLTTDPSSAVCAALHGWDWSLSREGLATLDVFDLLAQINSDPKKNPKPHSGRPGHAKRATKPDTSLSQERIRQVLRDAGHDL